LNEVSKFIMKNRIFTIINIDDYHVARRCVQLSMEGGLRIFEISSLIPYAYRLVEDLSRNMSILVGMGSIAEEDTIEKAKEVGADFITVNHVNEELIQKSRELGLFVIGESMTPTEALKVHHSGADLVGLFPVEPIGGARYIKLLLDSFPFLKIQARGGLNIYNFVDMLDAGALTVGISTGIFDSKTLERLDFDVMRKKVNLFLGRYHMWEKLRTSGKEGIRK